MKGLKKYRDSIISILLKYNDGPSFKNAATNFCFALINY
jgi:hypothetical protein